MFDAALIPGVALIIPSAVLSEARDGAVAVHAPEVAVLPVAEASPDLCVGYSRFAVSESGNMSEHNTPPHLKHMIVNLLSTSQQTLDSHQ